MMRISLYAAAFTFLMVSGAHAVPSQMTVQGRLTDAVGAPLPSGAKTFTFRIFNASAAGVQVWPGGGGEVQSITSGVDGLWIGLLGAMNPLTDAVFADSVRWLEIDVDGTTLPRVRLVTGPYAHRVSTVDAAAGGTITSKVTIGASNTNSGNDGFVAGADNQATANYTAIPGGVLNSASGESSVIAGGQQNAASGFASSVAGGSNNDATSTYSAVGGGYGNTSSNLWTTVSGGFSNTADDAGASVGGGRFNYARGQYSTVAGGGGLALTDSNSAGGDYARIGGGYGNVASGHGSSVDGGHYNIAQGFYSTIGGGQFNSAQGTLSTIGGGGNTNIFNGQNIAQGYATVVAGGSANRAVDNYSTIGGGLNGQTRGGYATLAGGYGNLTDGNYATVGGGDRNAAAGTGATVCGGILNYTNANGAVVVGGDTNSAQGTFAVVGGGILNDAPGHESVVEGGRDNLASGNLSTVGGGGFNEASGVAATVPGGEANAARGDFSFAAGSYARANHFASFVWSDRSSPDTVHTTAANQFLIRAAGGVGIGTTSPAKTLQIGEEDIVGTEGMIRLESRSSTGSLDRRSWEIGVPQTGAVTNGKGYDFVIDDIGTGVDPEAIVQWGTGYLGLAVTDPAFRIELPNLANNGGQGRANAWVTYSSR
ncbi:MAG TPA: hypothetical protein VNN55_12700, partial [bacterium]|nr:hypothetical protein [bacterium]